MIMRAVLAMSILICHASFKLLGKYQLDICLLLTNI